MKMTQLSFEFHGRLRLHVESDDPLALDFFAAEYGLHAADTDADLPTVWLHFERSKGQALNLPGYTIHAHKFLARWAYRVKMTTRQIKIEAIGNRFSIAMIHHMLVHPSLRFLAAKQGVLMLHAGAVACNGRSILFSGRGGAGKTTTTSLLLAYGQLPWQVHADDYVFLADGPLSLGYWTRAHLYRDLLRWVPEVAERLCLNERLRLEVLGRVRAWSGERIKWPVRMALPRLWPGRILAAESFPAALVLLRRAAVDAPVLCPAESITAAVQELLEMNFYEARHYIHLLRKQGALDEVGLSDWRAAELALIERAVTQIPLRVLCLPQKRIEAHALAEGLAMAVNEVVA
jgi:hypothetical protein